MALWDHAGRRCGKWQKEALARKGEGIRDTRAKEKFLLSLAEGRLVQSPEPTSGGGAG